MKYTLNIIDESNLDLTDISVLKHLYEYYTMLLDYLRFMIQTDNSKIFYRLVSIVYSLNYEKGEFTKECEKILGLDAITITTNILKFDDSHNQMKKVYNEKWDVIPTKDIKHKKRYSNKELERMINTNSIIVLEKNEREYLNNKYVNVIDNETYYMGSKKNTNQLSSKLNINKNSYYYIENCDELVRGIADNHFSEERIQDDILLIEHFKMKYLLMLKDAYKSENKKSLVI